MQGCSNIVAFSTRGPDLLALQSKPNPLDFVLTQVPAADMVLFFKSCTPYLLSTEL